jgi:hypothetical protein
VLITAISAPAAEWIRAGINTNQPIWGVRGGLQFAIPPGGFTWGDGGPRGLIRIGYPTLAGGQYDLINFIAIEPVVNGRRGFSELEQSARDGRQGKHLATGSNDLSSVATLNSGALRVLSNGVEELSVPLAVERFANGAHVRLVLTQRSDTPEELRFRIHAQPDSAAIERCILTATMGNKARARILWAVDKPVSSRKLYPDFHGGAFTDHTFLPLTRLPRARNGDVLIAISNDEADPAQHTADLSRFWQYRGEKVTQYWRKPASEVRDDLRCAVNARFTYWMSQTPIPGGVAFENFELVEKFRDGQEFIFGVSKRSPAELLRK